MPAAALAALGEPESRRPRRQLPQVGAELEIALRAFRVEARRAARGEVDVTAAIAAYDTLRAADLLVRAHFRTTAQKLERLAVGPEVFERLAAAERTYVERIDAALAPLEAPFKSLRKRSSTQDTGALRTALAGALQTLSEHAPPPPPILGANALPYRPLRLAAREPRTQPTVVPGYGDLLAAPPGAAEVEATPEAPLADEILELAASLGYDYVKIFELVRNDIRTEWYAGSVKGAVETLRARAGNDVDQASLLVALWRASRLATRYVHGVIELPIGDVGSDLGLSDPADVIEALTRAGIANKPVIRGGRVAAMRLEHTWVSAYVPYSNYRGAVVDFSGRLWLPFAPAIQRWDRTPSTGILRQMGYPVDLLVDRFLGEPQPQDVVATLRGEVETYLSQEGLGTYEEQLGSATVIEQRLRLLPGSLPMQVTAVTGEEAALSNEHKVTFRLVTRAGTTALSPVVLDGTLPLQDVLARRVTLSYIPATVDDHRTVNGFGGLSGVPAYLVHLRPQIKVDGRPVLVGEGSLEMGIPHRIEVEISGPFGSERIEQTVTSGSYHALGVGAQTSPREVPAAEDLADTEQLAAALLSRIALDLDERWGAAEDELSGLLDVAVMRPVPSMAVVTNAVKVEEILGLPFLMRWTGVTLDATLRVAEPIARGDDPAAERDWMRLSALQGSVLEHRIFEDVFLVESISADKGIALAREAGMEVLVFDDPADPRLATLPHPRNVGDDVARWLGLGLRVEIPAEPITLNAVGRAGDRLPVRGLRPAGYSRALAPRRHPGDGVSGPGLGPRRHDATRRRRFLRPGRRRGSSPRLLRASPRRVDFRGRCQGDRQAAFLPPPKVTFQGFNQDAAHVGREATRRVRPTLFYWIPELDLELIAPGSYRLVTHTGGSWEGATGQVEFTIDNDGSVTDAWYAGDGVYETAATAGPVASVHTVTGMASEILINRQSFDPQTGFLWTEEEILEVTVSSPMAEIFALDPKITAIDPDPVVISDAGKTQDGILVNYQIEPIFFVPAQLVLELWAESRSAPCTSRRSASRKAA